MIVRRLLVASAAALASAAAPPAAGAAERLAANNAAEFPLRSFVLSPDRPLAIDGSRATVTENGKPVRDARLEPVGARPGSSDVILVIDASESMRGGPIRAAIEAARALAERRQAAQRVGVVLFNNGASLRLAPTNDPARIDAALGQVPALEGGTRIFDATSLAMGVLRRSRSDAGSIVVLSDGNDTGSTATTAMLAAAARRTGVRIFTVGLRSKQFDPRSLRTLALAGGGDYREAASARDLRGIFDRLGSRFAGEYLLSYRSEAAPRTRVDVLLRAPGLPGGATASYVVPAAATVAQAAPDDTFWAQDGAVAVVALVLGLLVGIGALALLGVRKRNRRNVQGRIAAFGMPVVEPIESTFDSRSEPGFLDRLSWWETFKEEVDIAQLERTPQKLLAIGVTSAAGLALLMTAATGSVVLLLLTAVGPVLTRMAATKAADHQRTQFDAQLVDTLQGAASALRAGHSITSALAEVSGDAAEPTRRELGQALADERLGKPLDDALRDVSRRMKSRDVEQIALVSQLQRTTGANMAEVLDRVADTVRERQDLKRTIQALTAQGRMARGILTSLPPGLLLVLAVLNPSYIEPLFTEAAGIAAVIVGATMTIAGSFAIKKIVTIEV